MYRKFFNLQTSPFGTSPDPRFLYMMPHTREALAGLEYGISERKGFTVLTGEVGTGKTLLLRCLLRLLEESRDITYAYVFNNRLTSTEFLQYMLLDFGLQASGKNKCEMLFDLSQFQIGRAHV